MIKLAWLEIVFALALFLVLLYVAISIVKNDREFNKRESERRDKVVNALAEIKNDVDAIAACEFIKGLSNE